MMTFLAVILGLLSLLVFMLIIRKAIDDSKTSQKLDVLIQEIRLLRKEIKENKHIIDKRL
jgi:hypothetical protein